MATNNSVNSPLSGTTGTGNFVGSTSPTITTPRIAQINDTNGNASLSFTATASAVNYINCVNNVTGYYPNFSAAGTDTNIDFAFNTKGTGVYRFISSATTSPFVIYNGTGNQHNTTFAFSNTAASRTVTFPDLSGTVALSGASQSVSFGTITTSNSTLNQGASNTTFTGSTALSQTFVPYQTSYNELSGFDFFEGAPFARIAAYKTASGSIIKMGTSNNYGSGITNTAVTIDQSGVMTLSSALPVGSGGTGATSATAYAVLCGGTTSTGAFQSVASVGTAGQVLTSNGAGALPTFQTLQQGNIVAWVNFNGTGTIAIRGSGNVSSLTDNGTGDTTINFTNAVTDVNYSISGTNIVSTGVSGYGAFVNAPYLGTINTTNVRVLTASSSAAYDCIYVSIQIVR